MASEPPSDDGSAPGDGGQGGAQGDVRADRRQSAALRIRLKYPDEAMFIERYSVNISRGGIFIASKDPRPVGATLRFEFQLADGAPVLRGEGAVVWVKPYDPQQPGRAHGMGVRFSRLDGDSRLVIDKALAWKEQASHDAPEPPAPAPSPSLPLPLPPPIAASAATLDASDEHSQTAATAETAAFAIELEADEPSDEERAFAMSHRRAITLEAEPEPEPQADPNVEPGAKLAAAPHGDPLVPHAEPEPDAVDGAGTGASTELADALAYITARTARPSPHRPFSEGADEAFEQLFVELGLPRAQLRALLQRPVVVRGGDSNASVLRPDEHLDRLLDPPRPESLPQPPQALVLVKRLLDARGADALDPNVSAP